jgi:hypothetical protein
MLIRLREVLTLPERKDVVNRNISSTFTGNVTIHVITLSISPTSAGFIHGFSHSVYLKLLNSLPPRVDYATGPSQKSLHSLWLQSIAVHINTAPAASKL